MKFFYVAQFEPDEDGTYAVTFPDLDGAMTYGSSKEEAMRNAQEALELYLEPDAPYQSVMEFPDPTSIEQVEVPEGGFTSYILAEIDLSKYAKSVKKTLTIPGWLNEEALKRRINFSKVLQDALIEKIRM